MADAAHENPAANYYSGRPLNYDAQQAQAAPQARPPPAADEQTSALPPAPRPEPPQDEGEHANHTQVHGVPGYYKGRVNKNKTGASDQIPAVAPLPPPAPGAAAAAAADPSPAAVQLGKEPSFIDKLLMCFKGGKTEK